MDNTMTSALSSSSESKTNDSEQTQWISCNERQEFFQDKEEMNTYLDQDEEIETGRFNEPEVFDLSRKKSTDPDHFKEGHKECNTDKEHHSTWVLQTLPSFWISRY